MLYNALMITLDAFAFGARRLIAPLAACLLLAGCRPAASGGLLFASARSGNWEILLQARPGEEALNLTRYPSGDRYPDWSPDKRQLVFASDRSGSFGLYLVEPDGGNLRVLTDSPYPDTGPRWSHAGIVFVSDREDRNEELYLIQPEGGEARRLTKDPAADYDPAWLPDGKGLVFVSLRSGKPELWRLPLEGVPEQLSSDGADKRSPDVSPDGKSVVYARRQGKDWQLALLNLGDGSVKALTKAPGWAGVPRWVNDHELLYAARSAEKPQERLLRLSLPDGRESDVSTGSGSRDRETAP